MKTVVAALGGNALGNTPDEQKQKVLTAVPALVRLVKDGCRLIVTHGSGPQVGAIFNGLAHSAEDGIIESAMPFPECSAMSQGYIGYHLQNALLKGLRAEGLNNGVVSVITQVVVDPGDSGFSNPSKPIGPCLTEEEAKLRMAEHPSHLYMDDAGRGWRRTVASPLPLDIIETDAVKALLDAGCAVIAGGGGGIPVIKTEDGGYEGVDAVVDKDYTAACIADLVGADCLYNFTIVDGAMLNHGKPGEKLLENLSCEEAEHYIGCGEFDPGGMLPKVDSAVRFMRSKPGREAVICSLENAEAAFEGKSGSHFSA